MFINWNVQSEVVTVWEVPDVKVKVLVEIEVMIYVPSTPAPDVASKIIEFPTALPWLLLVIVTVVPVCAYTAVTISPPKKKAIDWKCRFKVNVNTDPKSKIFWKSYSPNGCVVGSVSFNAPDVTGTTVLVLVPGKGVGLLVSSLSVLTRAESVISTKDKETLVVSTLNLPPSSWNLTR